MKLKKILLFLAILVLALPSFFRLQTDPDLWWHVKFGLDHIQSGKLPEVDPYAYTSLKKPWVNHEWLTEMLLAKAYLTAGGEGIFWFRAFLLTLILGGLFLLFLTRGFHPLLTLLTFTAVLPYLQIYIIARPHSTSYLLVLVFLLVIEAARKGKTAWLWLLPVLTALWVNLHGGFVLGLTLSFLAALEFYYTKKQKTVLLLPVLCLLAALLNPFGAGLLRFVWGELFVDHGFIAEWQPFLIQPLWQKALLLYLLFSVPAVAGLLISRPRRFTETVFFFFAAGLALLHARFFILLVLTGSLIFYEAASDLSSRSEKKAAFPRTVFFAVLIFLMSWSAWKGAEEFRRSGFRLRLNAQDYPAQAVAYLKAHKIGPNLCLTFQWGGYAIWSLYPDYKVSVDGRNTSVYAADYIPRTLEAYKNGDLKTFLGTPKPDVLLVENTSPIDQAASASCLWTEVYRDPVAVIYVPLIPAGRPAVPAETSGPAPARS